MISKTDFIFSISFLIVVKLTLTITIYDCSQYCSLLALNEKKTKDVRLLYVK